MDAALRSTRVPVTISDMRQPDCPLVFVNDAFLALTGYEREEVIGRNCRFLQGPETDAGAIALMKRCIADGQDTHVELLNYRKDGSSFWNALYMSPIPDSSGEARYYWGTQIDNTRLKQAEDQLREAKLNLERAVAERTRELEEALDQRTHLLHEVDHRVKNNLQLISSLMLLQSRRSAEPMVKRELGRVMARLNAISTVHRRLFQNEDAARFDVAEFLRDLAADLTGASGRDDVSLELALEPVDIPASQAAPLALLLNELLSNALQHAFPEERGGRVRISIVRGRGVAHISIVDDGIGSADKLPGFGLTIVDLLRRQLKADARFVDAEPGVAAHITLPIQAAA